MFYIINRITNRRVSKRFEGRSEADVMCRSLNGVWGTQYVVMPDETQSSEAMLDKIRALAQDWVDEAGSTATDAEAGTEGSEHVDEGCGVCTKGTLGQHLLLVLDGDID